MINVELMIGMYLVVAVGVSLFLGTRTPLPASLKGCILIFIISVLWPVLIVAYILMMAYAFVSTLFKNPEGDTRD
ncbi:hypothetical protein FDI40_gp525 [Agrobacterium phage Atu_ph07]|uniref:Transmembrane protein n=1 Tax=Agrobacterium phage Atu_ph07 TaxID=2024264 RepID=A0A2L0V0G0_9CAUD|nr:hypothetical protein FDI40_gp525 [Agrobacterium phage Atu_ph07]AUZ95284.1 hypothetical protein [Agrobacterium phage Atu_ph07]